MPDFDLLGHIKPFVLESGTKKSLHFSMGETQSRMDVLHPECLDVGYTRTMMGFLLFHPEPRDIAMIGLGGGSLAKFCHRHLPRTRIHVVEINPHVIALRDEFEVPAESNRFTVSRGDGAEFVRAPPHPFDVLLVDGYDRGSIRAGISVIAFVERPRAALCAKQSSRAPHRQRRQPSRRVCRVSLGTPRILDWGSACRSCRMCLMY